MFTKRISEGDSIILLLRFLAFEGVENCIATTGKNLGATIAATPIVHTARSFKTRLQLALVVFLRCDAGNLYVRGYPILRLSTRTSASGFCADHLLADTLYPRVAVLLLFGREAAVSPQFPGRARQKQSAVQVGTYRPASS